MGKGGGCVPSTFRKRQPAALGTTSMDRPGGKDEEDDLQQQQQQTVAGHGDGDVDLDLQSRDRDADTVAVKAAESSAEQAQATIANDSDPAAAAAAAPLPRKLKIYVVYYSMYGHVEALARRMKEGIEAEGVEGLLFRVPETLSAEVLQKMQARPPSEDVPEIEGATQLLQADGFLFGFPTRYGAMAAQMKAFFDSTGGLWREQLLSGKPAGFFLSTGTQGGGQESTAWTAITQLAHHGMLYVPVGYTFGAGMFKMDEIRGGSPYGAGVFAGDGTRQASSLELSLAEHQGKYMAAIVKKLSHN